MNLRSKSRTNVSSGEVADFHQVRHVDKPGSSANRVRKHRDMLYAHRERHQYLKAKDRVQKQLERQRPLLKMELEKRRVKERERKRLYRQKQKELKPQSQSTPDYIETRRVKKNALRRQKHKLLHLKLPSLFKKPAAVRRIDSPLEGFDDSSLSCSSFIWNNMLPLSKKKIKHAVFIFST